MNTGHLSVYLVVFRLVLEDVDEGEDEDGRHVNRERDEEHEKITVVATTDAVVHPGAVMVKDLENKRNETLGSLKSQLSSKIINSYGPELPSRPLDDTVKFIFNREI